MSLPINVNLAYPVCDLIHLLTQRDYPRTYSEQLELIGKMENAKCYINEIMQGMINSTDPQKYRIDTIEIFKRCIEFEHKNLGEFQDKKSTKED